MMPSIFNYTSEVPPSPYLLVRIATPDGSRVTDALPGKVDTGADMTVIPSSVAEGLGLVEFDRLLFAGFGGPPVELPVYDIRLTILGLDPIDLTVTAIDSETYSLIGRDVLNKFVITLDGPNRKLRID